MAHNFFHIRLWFYSIFLLFFVVTNLAQEKFNGVDVNLSNLYKLSDAKSRSISPENLTGKKGKGGMATEGTGAQAAKELGQGWKVSPSIIIKPGTTFHTIAKAQTVINPSDGFVLKNSYVQLEFEPDGMGLKSMIDLRSGYNHIKPVVGKHLLWEVTFDKGTQRETIDNNYKACDFVSVEKLSDGTQHAVLEWNNMRWWKENNVVSVQVTIDLPRDCGVATWRIFVQNNSDYWGLWDVAFPKVNGFPDEGVYDIARPAFAVGGLLLKKHKDKLQGRYPSGGWPMQFMSFNDSINAVYLATMDPDGRAKDFLSDCSKSELEIIHYPENAGIAGSDWSDYYPIAFGVYQGNWLQAALRYREWATRQKWAKPLSKRHDVPPLMKNLGIWVRDFWIWDSSKVSPHQINLPLIRAQRDMDVPMGLHWYFWHQNPFDNLYPHFLPSKPGFRERVKDLVDRGNLVMPYINGSSADMNISDWDELVPHAIYDEAGGFIMDTTSLSGRLVEMCPSQEFWQSKIVGLTDSLVSNYGCNGVYIDQVSAIRNELCFSKNHGHPLGGGRWWTDGNRELMRKIRYVAHHDGHEAVITSEGADEVFLDLVDGNLMWAEPSDREIPLMYVVYSGYTIFFGSRCDYSQSDNLFCFAQGRAFIEGRQNGWMDLGLFKPEYKEKAAYLRQCAKYHLASEKFLTYGRLLQPVYPINKVPTFVDERFGMWGVKHKGTTSGAEAMLWQSEDGHLGIFIANYINQKVPFTFSIDPKKFGLDVDYKLIEITPERNIPVRTASGVVNLNEFLEPRGLKVIEIAPLSN